MSEFDSESGRKGFVRDVMRRISSTGPQIGYWRSMRRSGGATTSRAIS
jgi:hypothetical protein